jgi:hypothetical protein
VRRGKRQVQEEGLLLLRAHPFDRLVSETRKTLIVDKIGSDLHPSFSDHLLSTGGRLLVRRHNAIVAMAFVRFLGCVDRRRQLCVAALKPGQDAVVERGGYAVEVVKPFV